MEIKQLLKSLQDFQHEVVFVKAKSTGHHGKYAQLKDVVMDTKDALKKHGLMVFQSIGNLDGRTTITTNLVHLDTGQMITNTHNIAYQGEDSQKQGSAITYARRYAYVTILGLLVDADDDGQLASSVGEDAGKKESAAEFYESKSALTKYLTKEKGMTIPQISELVKNTLKKDRMETVADVEKVRNAVEVS